MLSWQRRLQRGGVRLLFCILLSGTSLAAEFPPVYVGLDAEFGHESSTSAEAIRRGILIAIAEINAQGGVLGGRPLALETRDNRSVPARGLDNIKELATKADLVAVFCGKFSPVVQQSIAALHELKLPLLDPWAAADDIIDNGREPNFAFRLSLRDSLAMQKLVASAAANGHTTLGVVLPNTGWGRSSLKAIDSTLATQPGLSLVGSQWYNWGDKSLLAQYNALRVAGAKGIVLVANEIEGSIFVKEIASLPESERLPVYSHWGVTGGQFFALAGPALKQIDFRVVQTFSFLGNSSAAAQRVVAAAMSTFGVKDVRHIESPVGMAHAYDLTHILARAIHAAGSTDRSVIRDELERVTNYNGLLRHFDQPFTATRHDALTIDDVFLSRYAQDGAIERELQTNRAQPNKVKSNIR